MQAITTKHLQATDTKGRRIKATSAGGMSVIIPWDYELDDRQNHWAAAMALINKLGWYGPFTIGETKTGYAVLFVTDVIEIKRP